MWVGCEQKGALVIGLPGLPALQPKRIEVDALLRQPGAPRADWRALLGEATALCAQWGDEMRAGGDIEDEDRDPVGLPPR